MKHPSLDASTFKVTARMPFAQPPWRVQGRSQWSGFRIVDAQGRGIANFPQRERQNDGEREATAALMCGAPGMLAALQLLEEWLAKPDAFTTFERIETAQRVINGAIKGAQP